MDALSELHRHLTVTPLAPLSAGLRTALVEYLSTGRRARDRALCQLAQLLDPTGVLGPWEMAGKVQGALAVFDRAGRLSAGYRPPRNAIEHACLAVVRCGGALPESRRAYYDALRRELQSASGSLTGSDSPED